MGSFLLEHELLRDDYQYYPKEWGYPNQAAEFYLDNNLLPITPHTWKISNNNENESDQLVDGHPLTIAKLDKAQSFSMDFIFIHDWYYQRDLYNSFYKYQKEDPKQILPYDTAGMPDMVWYEVQQLTDYLWEVKQKREPVVITILYPSQENLNLKALLDSYEYTQDADDASDYKFSLTFTEYHEALNQEVDSDLTTTLARHNLRALRNSSSTEVFSPEDYEAATGKHSLSWEEIKGQMEEWLKGEYKKLTNEEMTDFDSAFKKWWESDEDRKNLPMPSGDKELGYWWNNFIEQSNELEAKNQTFADIEAWLNAELKKLTKDPPDNFWDRFKLWWESDPSRRDNPALHRPNTDAELFNWWEDFMAQSKQIEENNKKQADIEAWLNVEIKKVTDQPPDSFNERFTLWWNSDPTRAQTMVEPATQAELFNWWDDFQLLSQNEKTLNDIKAWLVNELKSITSSPPSEFDEAFRLWWDSDETRKNTMHLPDSQSELLNWWNNFMHESEIAQQSLEEIKAWLDKEVKKLTKNPPTQFKERLKLWWESDETRKNTMHMPETDTELINWWKDFMDLSATQEERKQKMADIKAWLNAELTKLTRKIPADFWEGFRAWWESDPDRRDNPNLHMPDNEKELINWWDDFMKLSKGES